MNEDSLIAGHGASRWAAGSAGSATLEYVFITIFGLILTTGAMKILHSLYINKLDKINQELQLDLDMDSLKIDGFF